MFITFELDRDELARKKISMNIAICKNREDFSGFSYCEKYLSFSEFTSINKKELLVLNGLLVFFLMIRQHLNVTSQVTSEKEVVYVYKNAQILYLFTNNLKKFPFLWQNITCGKQKW